MEENDNRSESVVRSGQSELFDVMRRIECIITCYIHLGIMKNPKKLPCKHVFCYECLQINFNVRGDITCAICRDKGEITDVDQLPSALPQQCIIELLSKYKINKYLDDLDNKIRDILRKYSNEVYFLNSDILFQEPMQANPFIATALLPQEPTHTNPFIATTFSPQQPSHTNPYIPNTFSAGTNSFPRDMVDMEYYQQIMKENSKYELIKRDHIKDKTKDIQIDLSMFDVHFSDQYPYFHKIVLVDSLSNKLVVYSDSCHQEFYIKLKGKIVKPEYIKIIQGDLIISGRFEDDGTVISAFLHCNMQGEIIRRSELFPWQNDSRSPLMLGFDMNQEENIYYLCMPKLRKILTYDNLLRKNELHYEFDNDNQPEYVAYCATLNQLWISCPENKRIVILNVESGTYRTVSTEPFLPKMIFVTHGERIIFLDSIGNRLVWIKRFTDNILTQILDLPFVNESLKIIDFRESPLAEIIITSEAEVFIYQLEKYTSKSNRISEWCNVL